MSHELLSVVAERQGDLPRALRHQERSTEIARALAARFPDNERFQWEMRQKERRLERLRAR